MTDNVDFVKNEKGLYEGSHNGFQAVGALMTEGEDLKIILNAETEEKSGISYVIYSRDIPRLLNEEGEATIYKVEFWRGREYKERSGSACHSISDRAINFKIDGYTLLTTPKIKFLSLIEGKEDPIKISFYRNSSSNNAG